MGKFSLQRFKLCLTNQVNEINVFEMESNMFP